MAPNSRGFGGRRRVNRGNFAGPEIDLHADQRRVLNFGFNALKYVPRTRSYPISPTRWPSSATPASSQFCDVQQSLRLHDPPKEVLADF
jgi:hypothetical protein